MSEVGIHIVLCCALCLLGCTPKSYKVHLSVVDTSAIYSWQGRGTAKIGGEMWEFSCDPNSRVVDVNLCDDRSFRIWQKDKNRSIDVGFGVPFKLAGRIARLDSVRKGRLYVGDLGHYVDSSTVGSKMPYFEANLLVEDSVMLDLRSHIRAKADIHRVHTIRYERVDLRAQIQGKTALLLFWDPWCETCIKSVPPTNEVTERIKHRNDAVVLGLVDVPQQRMPFVSKGMNMSGVRFVNYVTPRQEIDQLPAASWVLNLFDYPTYVVVDKEGTIVYRSDDGPKGSKEQAIEFFEQLINTK